MKVLVLDANLRSALAITRSLGRKGVRVVVADETGFTLAGSSKYCGESFSYPSPYSDPAAFFEKVAVEIRARQVDVLFPVSDVTTGVILRNRDRLGGVRLPFAPFETYDLLTDKCRLLNLAAKLGLRIPETQVITAAADIARLNGRLTFPTVLKPIRSRIFSDGHWVKTNVRYAWSREEISSFIAANQAVACPLLIQEYIHGTGCGLFALYDHGRPVAFFSHRRLREKPASGGVSVLSESVLAPPALLDAGRRLLNAVGWHGVAMVEFKSTAAGVPYLMEVNARFWGSLQLAIDAGVDFPWLLLQLAEGHSPARVSGYRVGLKNRWLLGDAVRLGQLLSGKAGGDSPVGKLRSLRDFLHFFDSDLRFEVNRWDDMRPCLFELARYLSAKTRQSFSA